MISYNSQLTVVYASQYYYHYSYIISLFPLVIQNNIIQYNYYTIQQVLIEIEMKKKDIDDLEKIVDNNNNIQ